MFLLKDRARAATAILLMLAFFACTDLTAGNFPLTSDATAAGKELRAFVMSVKLKNPHQKQSDGAFTDTIEILASNPGQGQTLRFKFWQENSGMRVAPVVLHVSGRAEPKNGKWSLRMRRDSAKMLTFTVRSTGADKYCTQDKYGMVCTDDPEPPVTTDG
jgi:hypothetical protein